MTTTPKFRKTKSGEWAIFGPADTVRRNCPVQVRKADGTYKVATPVRISKKFVVDGTEMVYGYLDDEAPRTTGGSRRTRRRTCPTDGNCSSFGDGRSCGADDCDGW